MILTRIFVVLIVVGVVSCNINNTLGWYINVTCSSGEDCHEVIGNRSNCIHGVCQCLQRYHLDQQEQCIEDRGLHESCEKEDQCYWGPQMVERITCDSGVCSCRPGYIESAGRICIRFFLFGASATIYSYPLLITLLAGIICYFN